ncbi:hypothetical protein [Halalkalicoccus salilacus]|uniref:hypothetical protein n=1 Tax=Halalkalicoccus salilacus TaxID=3117459 RepID=UPI00300EC54D
MVTRGPLTSLERFGSSCHDLLTTVDDPGGVSRRSRLPRLDGLEAIVVALRRVLGLIWVLVLGHYPPFAGV